MQWEIVVRPTSAALDEWTWQAARQDQTQFRSGAAYTVAQALIEARQAATEYEQYVLDIENNVVTEFFTPDLG